ncbi:MAG: hypothetical protein Q7K55_07820 [Candidatus Levybacteria bacterium]|nr:hypothetical protein [Candidatus Levybacteria bacterium]
MGTESGGSSESLEIRRSPENPFERGIEVRGDRNVEDAAERENYWLAEMGITPEGIERLKQYPANADVSTEYLIYDLLYAKLIEKGAEWSSPKKTRVRNLLGMMRVVGYPNMTEEDKTTLIESACVGNMTTLQYEITQDAVSDVRWIWRTFGLQVPTQGVGRGILESQTPRSQ